MGLGLAALGFVAIAVLLALAWIVRSVRPATSAVRLFNDRPQPNAHIKVSPARPSAALMLPHRQFC